MDAPADREFHDFMLGRWPGLVRLAYGLTGDQALAEDLAQTALTRAYASWSRVRRADDPDAYVRKIVLNANRSRFRARRVAEQLTGAPPDSGAPDETGRSADPVGADGGADDAPAGAARGGCAQVLAGPDRDPGRCRAGLLGREREEPGCPRAGQAQAEPGPSGWGTP